MDTVEAACVVDEGLRLHLCLSTEDAMRVDGFFEATLQSTGARCAWIRCARASPCCWSLAKRSTRLSRASAAAISAAALAHADAALWRAPSCFVCLGGASRCVRPQRRDAAGVRQGARFTKRPYPRSVHRHGNLHHSFAAIRSHQSGSTGSQVQERNPRE